MLGDYTVVIRVKNALQRSAVSYDYKIDLVSCRRSRFSSLTISGYQGIILLVSVFEQYQ